MTHQEIQDQLSMLRDAELPEAERRTLSAHVEACAECRALAERWRLLGRVLTQAPRPEADEPFVASVMARLPQPAVARKPIRAPWHFMPKLALGVAMLSLMVLVPRTNGAVGTESLLLSGLPEELQWPFVMEPPSAEVLGNLEEELP
jgi:anti-sigma factor RsiW